MKLLNLLLIALLLCSCSVVDKIEAEHYSFYAQKAFFCTEVTGNRAYFINAPGTRNYICKSKQLSKSWHEGDTLIVDKNLEVFWNLKEIK